MKRIFIIVVTAAVLLIAWIIIQFVSIKPVSKTNLKTEQPVPSSIPSNEPYPYSLISVNPSSTITLIPNFNQKKDAATLSKENGCISFINGGFYDTSGNPLGLFFTNKQTYSTQIQSALINAYYWMDLEGATHISTVLSDNSWRFALQTGPALIINGEIMPLAIRNDELARRMVVAKTINNRDIFLVLYSGESVFSGPRLSEVPSIIRDISDKEDLNIVDAVNLDGGSASAFNNQTTTLSELTPVGSILCVK